MFSLQRTKKFDKSVSTLPPQVRNSLNTQLRYLVSNPKYPSLQTKLNIFASNKYKTNVFEGRITNKYKFLWKYKEGKVILLLIAGNHDVVEGKK